MCRATCRMMVAHRERSEQRDLDTRKYWASLSRLASSRLYGFMRRISGQSRQAALGRDPSITQIRWPTDFELTLPANRRQSRFEVVR
jgi:hypothetical protein